MDIRCNGIVADVLSAGGACRVAGRRDASRIHARSEAGLCRLLEAEAVYREYTIQRRYFHRLPFQNIVDAKCKLDFENLARLICFIDGSRLGSDRVSRKFAENRLAATRFVRNGEEKLGSKFQGAIDLSSPLGNRDCEQSFGRDERIPTEYIAFKSSPI